MNERIKELAEESGAWAYFNEGNEKSAVMDSKALSNFAELIVRECADRGSKAMYPSFDPDYVGRKIKQHFGVEE